MLEPNMESMVNQLVGEVESRYREQLDDANQKIQDLEQHLSILSTASDAISRDDYDALKKKLRQEQDDHLQVNRTMRDLETKLQKQMTKTEELEHQLQRFNSDESNNLRLLKQKDDRINDQRKQIESFQALSLKYRQETVDNMAGKKALESQVRQLEGHISELDQALELVSQRNQELTSALNESHNQILQLQTDLNDEVDKSATLQQTITFIKKKRENLEDSMSFQVPDMNKMEEDGIMKIQSDLFAAQNEISALKAQIEHYKDVELNNSRLEVGLTKRTKQLETVSEILKEKQMELESYRSATDEYQLKIVDYQDQLTHIGTNSEIRISGLKAQIELYKERADSLFNQVSSLEDTAADLNEKLTEERNKNTMYEESVYGLPQAISEMMQYKKMVSLRDAQLADLIHELNYYQRTIVRLEGELPKEFDYSKFYESVEQELVEKDVEKTQSKALDILEKSIAVHENAKLGNIKVILGNEVNPAKTLYFKSDHGVLTSIEDPKIEVLPISSSSPKVTILRQTENEIEDEKLSESNNSNNIMISDDENSSDSKEKSRKSARSPRSARSDKSDRSEDGNNLSETIHRPMSVPSKSDKYKGKRRFKKLPEKNNEKEISISIISECKDVAVQCPDDLNGPQQTQRNPSLYESRNMMGASNSYYSPQRQSYDRPRSYEEDKNFDEAFQTLQRNYDLCRRDRNDLQAKLNLFQTEYEAMQYELQNWRMQFSGMAPNYEQIQQQPQQQQENAQQTTIIVPPVQMPSSPRNSRSQSSDSESISSSRSSKSSNSKGKGMIQKIQASNEEEKKKNIVFSPKKINNNSNNNISNKLRSSYEFPPPPMPTQYSSFQNQFQSPQASPFSFSSIPLQNFRKILNRVTPNDGTFTLYSQRNETYVQATKDPPVLSIVKVPWSTECPKAKLDIFLQCETFQLPTPEELEVINARKNALKIEIDALHKKVAADAQTYEEAQNLVKQRDQNLAELQQTIKTLEGQLSEQREIFQQRLLGYKNEAERYVETFVIEKNEIDHADHAKDLSNIPDRDNELTSISIRLHELESSNAQLRLELQDSQESTRLLHRQNKALKQKIESMQVEKREIEEKFTGNEKQQALNGYSTKLKMRYLDIKKKYEDLQVEFNELKRTKTTRFDPLMMSRIIERAVDRNDSEAVTDKQLVARMKNAELRADDLRIRNEEMHLLLRKANGTIDRLNQLLSRKESQLTSFHEQIADLRQQVALHQGKS